MKNEHLIKEAGLTLEEIKTFGVLLAKRAMESGLSVIAINKASNEVAGVAFCLSSAK